MNGTTPDPRAGRLRDFIVQWLPVIVPGVIYALHSLLFRAWVIDDAGISYVYARNLAAGHGLVSQPGLMPVEGYSNFLWVIVLAPFFALRLFDPFIVPKLLGMIGVWVSFWCVYRALAPLRQGRQVTLVALTLTALQPAFAIWTVSGLENGLLVGLVGGLFLVCMRAYRADADAVRYAIWSGVLAAAIALTRPDGLVFAAAYPLVVVAGEWSRRGRWPIRELLVYAACFGALFGGFLLFRWVYFGKLLPNTYFAKTGVDASAYISEDAIRPTVPAKLVYLMRAIGGAAGIGVLGVMVLVTADLLRRRALDAVAQVTGVFLGLSLLVFLALPLDWMPEFRFATTFMLFFYMYVCLLFVAYIPRLSIKGRRRTAYISAIALIGIIGNGGIAARRSLAFEAYPPVSFSSVAVDNGERFTTYARVLELDSASVLLTDVGGTLYYSDLRVYDLAGLTDDTIAQTLGKDASSFYDYVFEVVKPDFIRVGGAWTLLSRFDDDARFREMYVPICESVDAWVEQARHEELMSGIYVRAAIAAEKSEQFEALVTDSGDNCALPSGQYAGPVRS